MKKNVLIIMVMFIGVNCFGQAPSWLWAKSAGGISHDRCNGICTDVSGNIYITGWFGAPIVFGTTTLTSTGSQDIFIAKYDASGNVIWAKSAGGIYSDQGISVSTDAGGNVFISGSFSSTSINFGTTIL